MIVMNEDTHGEARIRKGRKNHQGATQNEDIKLMLVNGYLAPTPTTTPREVITPTPKILRPTTYLTHQMKELEDASWPKVLR